MKYLQTYESHSVEWKSLGLGADRRDYEFEIDEIVYRVNFSGREDVVNLSFSTLNDLEGDWDFRNIGKSNPFKTMKTITEIVKDFIEKNPKVNRIKFFGREEDSTTPEWLITLLSSNQYLYYLSTYISGLLFTPKQWLSKPSRRTKMFNRWVDKEVEGMGWRAKRIGNQIQLIKEKS